MVLKYIYTQAKLAVVVSFQFIIIMTIALSGKSQNLLQKKYFPYPDKIRYDGSCLYIDGKQTFVYSAAFHYFRTPKALWRDRFAKIKSAGFNTVEICLKTQAKEPGGS